jgi:hypothetical protein
MNSVYFFAFFASSFAPLRDKKEVSRKGAKKIQLIDSITLIAAA